MRIRSYLLEIARRKQGKIKLSQVPLEKIKKLVKELWNEGLPKGEAPEKLTAVDGSRNKKEYAGYVVYAVGACSLRYRRKREGAEPEREEFLVEIDILKPQEYSESRLRTLMGITEVKAALRSLPEVDILLLDGSIVGDILRPTVFRSEIREEDKEWAFELFKELKSSFNLNGINSREFYGEVEKRAQGRDYPVVAGFVEYLEYLYSLYLLLKEGDGKLISVSKKSSSLHYQLDPLLPDIAVLYLANPPKGYSRPYKISLKEKKFKFPGEFEELLPEKEFWSFYFKVKDGIYKCETNLNPEEALKVLIFYEVNGYPFPLKEVHDRVKITNKDMEEVIRLIKHSGKTGREALGE
ncbi:DNA double-strand break repair nuclease NurA [Thermovibrio sp.]